jgi:hypothetical protein
LGTPPYRLALNLIWYRAGRRSAVPLIFSHSVPIIPPFHYSALPLKSSRLPHSPPHIPG